MIIGNKSRSDLFWSKIGSVIFIVAGACIASFALTSLLVPYKIIDGGIIGISLIIAKLLNNQMLFSPIFITLTIPFLYLAYVHLGKYFVITMTLATACFSLVSALLEKYHFIVHGLESFEAVCMGGILLGAGIGLIIRNGACIDGTEVLAIITQRTRGLTVGQTLLMLNIIVYLIAWVVYDDIQTAIRSMITYLLVSTTMDLVIAGMQDTRAVIIFSSRHDEIVNTITLNMGLGATLIHSTGGYTKSDSKIVFVVVEKAQLYELRSYVLEVDPRSFIVIHSISEFMNGRVFSPAKLQ